MVRLLLDRMARTTRPDRLDQQPALLLVRGRELRQRPDRFLAFDGNPGPEYLPFPAVHGVLRQRSTLDTRHNGLM